MKKNILITGITGGFGSILKRNLAPLFHALGTTTQPSLVEEDVFLLDLQKKVDVQRVSRNLNDEYGPLYALILNAGIAHLSHIDDFPMSGIRKLFEINLFGQISLIKKLQKPQKIVFISSCASKIWLQGLEIYGMTKLAMEHFLQNSVAKHRLLIVNPGPMKTNMKMTQSENALYDLWIPSENDWEDPMKYVHQIKEFLL